jgi:outer membrane protein assembly factor BamE (lipoprotein component of BamABCDE complex)
VLVVLGTPSTTSTIGGGAWYYISSKQTQSFAFQKPEIVDRRILAVYFDNKKRVERVATYGLQDGKLFDFNNRVTATAGGDSSFVKNLLQGLLRYSPGAPN